MKKQKKILQFLFFCVLLLAPLQNIYAGEAEGSQTMERMVLLVVQLSIILFAARIGGSFFEKLHLPSVLGEIAAGVIIGPFFLGHIALPGFAHGLFPIFSGGLPISPELHGLMTIASLVLLFLVGLETDIETFLSFSIAGSIVGIGGVVISFILGDFVTVFFSQIFFNASYSFGHPIPLFMGVITTATSVGISARILSEKRKLDSPEGVTILAGAVVDDVLAIILLAVVLGIINSIQAGHQVVWSKIMLITVKAIGIWLSFTFLGLTFSRQIGSLLKKFKDKNTIAIMSFSMAMLLAGIFEKSGLAMIIGAYIMGLSLSKTDLSFLIQESFSIFYKFFVPVFFCVTGMLVNFVELASWQIILFGMIFTLFSILGKLIGCSIPALFLNFNLRGALRIGMGMTPRGEVTLIITGIGLSMGFLPHDYFGIIILMTFMTTLITPFVLSKMLESDKPVLRKKKQIKIEHHQITYKMPNQETAELILNKVVNAFEGEGFYVHLLDTRKKIYHIRKNQTFVTLLFSPEKLLFDCLAQDVAFVHTLFYEVLAELERTMQQLQSLTDKAKIGKKIFSHQKDTADQKLHIAHVIHDQAVKISLKGQSKKEIIRELLDLVLRSGQLEVAQKKTALKDLLDREAVMSTGMQDGIAFPHARTSAVDHLVCVVGIKKEGIDFDSLDRKPCKIFILTLSPKDTSEPQLQFMAEVTKFLSSKENRSRLLSCKTNTELFEIFQS